MAVLRLWQHRIEADLRPPLSNASFLYSFDLVVAFHDSCLSMLQ